VADPIRSARRKPAATMTGPVINSHRGPTLATNAPAPDRVYGTDVTRRLRAMGIRDKPIAPASPWQNGFAERLIGSIRRECLDHIIVLGEVHLRRILKSYARYYNETRTHLALDKDAPLSRTVKRAGRILCRPILGGLHHEYVRI
jgi:transposase InsO family protein